MHHLHFRYVTEEPKYQSPARLFQLLDDLAPNVRANLLEGTLVDVNIFSEHPSEGARHQAEYDGLKEQIQSLARAAGTGHVLTYGLVSFILGNVHARCFVRLPGLIERKLQMVDAGFEDERQSVNALGAERDLLYRAYTQFCELVVDSLMNDPEDDEFGGEPLGTDDIPPRR